MSRLSQADVASVTVRCHVCHRQMSRLSLSDVTSVTVRCHVVTVKCHACRSNVMYGMLCHSP
eukprot:1391954-Amorphochlora_amoeboformis.AAC.1